MSDKDLANAYQSGQSFPPASRTATANGASVDFEDCGPEVTCILNVGDVGGGSSLIVTLESSPDDSTWTAISGATMSTIDDSSADDDTMEMITIFNRPARYVRAVGTFTGSTPDVIYGVVLMARKSSY